MAYDYMNHLLFVNNYVSTEFEFIDVYIMDL